MSTVVFFIDTSYLLELFRVPGCFEEAAVKEIRRRYAQAIEDKSRFFVPLPCIFELGNHIADVTNESSRNQLKERLSGTVISCVKKQTPWIITPSIKTESLPDLWKMFSKPEMQKGLSLTDTSIIREAENFKKKRRRFDYKVHIWTRDRELKAREPDSERNPFL